MVNVFGETSGKEGVGRVGVRRWLMREIWRGELTFFLSCLAVEGIWASRLFFVQVRSRTGRV